MIILGTTESERATFAREGTETDGKGKRKTRARSRDPRSAESSAESCDVAWIREEGKHKSIDHHRFHLGKPPGFDPGFEKYRIFACHFIQIIL